MIKILVSSCLLGEPVRYHGGDAKSWHPTLARWLSEGRVVSVCPEVLGGLGTPRPAAEILTTHLDGVVSRRVITKSGEDLTEAFEVGSRKAAHIAALDRIRIAILKDGSPSCGTTFVHDGTFTGNMASGFGITAALLHSCGITVFSENQFDEAERYLLRLENRGT